MSVDALVWFAETIYYFLPAYIANAAPVVFGGGEPLDGGRNWGDGRPILGSHKTVRGAASGLLVGTLVGALQLDPLRGVVLSAGAMGGDIIVAFFKRRLGLEPGSLFPVADQLGFIVLAVALSYLLPSKPTWEQSTAIIVATMPIHYLINVLAWAFKLKKDPW